MYLKKVQNMEARILVLNGIESGTLVKIKADTTIGRSEECSIRPMSPMVSRKHCRISIENDRYFVEDLGSTNGTAINGIRLNSRQEIKDGDKLSVATAQFKFVLLNESLRATEELVLEDEKSHQRITFKSD